MRKHWLAAFADLIVIAVFCAIGRRSHDEAVLAGLLRTVWPFAVGALLGWAVVLIARASPERVWPAGVLIWAGALGGGMFLRFIANQGVAPSFVAVAATVLAVFLLGWRLAYALAGRRRARAA